MVRIGIYLIILGIGAFILPMMGLQFRILSIFGENDWLMGLIVGVIGLGLVAGGSMTGQGGGSGSTE